MVEEVQKRLSGWKTRFLSRAAKVTLIDICDPLIYYANG